MAEFVMPSLGADMSAGTLIAWCKKPGDVVSRGDIIAEVHTDKADIDVEVFTSGVIEKLLLEPGEKVPVGTTLAIIREEGEPSAPPAAAVPPSAPPPPPAAPEPAARPAAARASRIVASPSAKSLAAELGVDLATVHGSGPGGRIQRHDVEEAAAQGPAAPAAPPAAPTAPATGAERAAAMRSTIAAAMARSKRETPHFYLSETIDLSRATAWIADENTRRPVQERLLQGVVLLKAAALALREVPELNATWQGDRVVESEAVNLGVAIFLRGGGLVAPALHEADTQTLDELMAGFRDLVSRARAGKLRSSELSDPTITVTSLGERGSETVYPIIFPPQVAIVGFGRIVERPWLSPEGSILACPLVTATLAADHRHTDGHRAATFLTTMSRLLQEPEEL
jgi:pyruvate dehydrogenase E2 component (dihydrolipoamide acetyltransferase)